MSNTSALGAARSRWWVIALFMAIGAALAALPTPDRVGQESQATRYTATHTLLLNNPALAQSTTAAVSPSQVALFATTGDVPERVKDIVGFAGNAAQLASTVAVAFDVNTGALTFATTQDSTTQAELVANTFAEQTNTFIAQRQDQVYQDRLAASLARLEDLQNRLDDITQQLATKPEDGVLLAQRDAISRQYSVAFEQNDLLNAEPTLLVFSTLASAQAVPIASSGLGAPQSRSTRGALGAMVGAIVGLGVAMVLGRLDRRLRSREQAETVTGLRARVIIPKAVDDRHAQAILTSGRHDSLSDAYRTLRNVVGFVHGSLPAVQRARITLVVSPGPGEGKTTLVSNLAATFAETGMRTIAVNTDFRRPQLAARLTDHARESMPYILEDLGWVEPSTLLRPTNIDNLSILDLGSLGSPDELARVTASLLPRLAMESDSIVIDSSPVAATAEVLELVPLADVIIVVVRLNRTEMTAAERTMATLKDLTNAPLLLVIAGMKQEKTDYYYDYKDRRQASSKPPKNDKGRRHAETVAPPPRRAKPRPPVESGSSQLNIDEIDEFLRRRPPLPDR